MNILQNTISITPLCNAHKQLQNALQEASSPLEVTGAIKCFEYCYELSWKTMRKILIYHGINDINSPRSVFAQAYANKLIDNLEVWNSFIEMRKLTSHTYDENLAETVFDALPRFEEHLLAFIKTIKEL